MASNQPSFIKLTDRTSGHPVVLDARDVLSAWTAIDTDDEDKEPVVTGSNVFTHSKHGVGDPPRIPVTETVTEIVRALNNAGCWIGWPDDGIM